MIVQNRRIHTGAYTEQDTVISTIELSGSTSVADLLWNGLRDTLEDAIVAWQGTLPPGKKNVPLVFDLTIKIKVKPTKVGVGQDDNPSSRADRRHWNIGRFFQTNP